MQAEIQKMNASLNQGQSIFSPNSKVLVYDIKSEDLNGKSIKLFELEP
jgi:hypothetical protein